MPQARHPRASFSRRYMGAIEARAFVFQGWEIVAPSDFVELAVTSAEIAEFAGKVRRNLVPMGRAAEGSFNIRGSSLFPRS